MTEIVTHAEIDGTPFVDLASHFEFPSAQPSLLVCCAACASALLCSGRHSRSSIPLLQTLEVVLVNATMTLIRSCLSRRVRFGIKQVSNSFSLFRHNSRSSAAGCLPTDSDCFDFVKHWRCSLTGDLGAYAHSRSLYILGVLGVANATISTQHTALEASRGCTSTK